LKKWLEANLDDAESWKRAVKGVDIVIHIATPTTDTFIFGEQETIRKAVDGKNKRYSNMRKILKIEPTDIKKSTLDMVQSFFDYGIVKK
jgi:hypothetical protein